eukprot:scaffold84832_cov119-Phaeocystis_antarctica.AAC.2
MSETPSVPGGARHISAALAYLCGACHEQTAFENGGANAALWGVQTSIPIVLTLVAHLCHLRCSRTLWACPS